MVNWKILIVSFLLVFLVSSLGGLFMSNVNSDWYDSIRPSLAPPDYWFGIVWPVLYVLIALSLYFSWINSKKKDKSLIKWSYGSNLVLNAIWTPLFFGLQNALLGFIDIILVLITTIWMIKISWKIDKKASYMLIPYLLWIIFATILNLQSLINS